MAIRSMQDLQSSLSALLDEAIPSLAASTQIFANAPVGTREIWLTIRTASITLTLDGAAATAGANGHDFAADGSTPYVFDDLNYTNALLVRAVENGGTATGWISYRG